MKELKDYLHLYLGCEGLANIFYGKEASDVSAKLIAVTKGSIVEVQCFDINGVKWDETTIVAKNKFKPYLRRLNTMSIEESRSIGIYYQTCHCSNPDSTCIDGQHPDIIEWGPESVIKACELGFDLFGLIESGLAINKNNKH